MGALFVWAGIGLFFFVSGFRQIRLRRHILALPTSKARSVAMGSVELSGRVRHHTPFEDPIFFQPCAYYNIKVRERRGSGKRSHWVTIYEKSTDATPFLLEDSTGCVFIYPRAAELHFENRIFRHSSALGRWFGKSDPITNFLANLSGGTRTLQLTAYIFRQGDPIYVLGHVASTLAGSVPGRKMELRDVSRELKNNPEKMKALDLNKDGVVDPVEWEAGLKKEVERQQAAQDSAPTSVQLAVVQKGSEERFVLADSEKNLLSKFAWLSWGQVVVGGAVALVCILQLLKNV